MLVVLFDRTDTLFPGWIGRPKDKKLAWENGRPAKEKVWIREGNELDHPEWCCWGRTAISRTNRSNSIPFSIESKKKSKMDWASSLYNRLKRGLLDFSSPSPKEEEKDPAESGREKLGRSETSPSPQSRLPHSSSQTSECRILLPRSVYIFSC